MSGFVNPYTFVPFPEVDVGTFRRAPAGHDCLGRAAEGPSRLLGEVEVVVTARSPLLVRDGSDCFPRREPPGADVAVPYLPGSGLAGVVRSLHESVAGGCLRVFDEEFVPTYRDAASDARSSLAGWRLALVEQADRHGRPHRVRLCTEVVRVRADCLAEVLGGPQKVVTGARVNVRPPGGRLRGLPVVTRVDDLAPGDEWVVLVTDSHARQKRFPYSCTVGRLTEGDDGVLSWTTEDDWKRDWSRAWDEFVLRVKDSDDMRRARGHIDEAREAPGKPVEADVWFGPDGREVLIGRRHEARPQLWPGHVLWVKPSQDGAGVTEFALSAIWRHTGSGAARERVPATLLPCRDPSELCPTCRVFGAVDTGGARGRRAEQRGYRGHVRFSDGYPLGEAPVLQRRQLAPLGRPRPGAGQFYLQNWLTKPNPNRVTKPGEEPERPLREWGARGDRSDWRMLRGRKHYWLTDTPDQRPLFRVTSGEFTGDMASVGETVPAGTRFVFTVRFENLDVAELGALLAALDPSRVLASESGQIGFAVGGGRPFGFGSCTSAITRLETHTAESWYATQPPQRVTVDQSVAAFIDAVDRGVRATWPALAAALHLDHVPPADVWYPPAQPIPPGELSAADLDTEVFPKFWREAQGYAVKSRSVPMLPLPHVTDTEQHLPVVERADDRPKPGDRPPRGERRSPADRRGSGTRRRGGGRR